MLAISNRRLLLLVTQVLIITINHQAFTFNPILHELSQNEIFYYVKRQIHLTTTLHCVCFTQQCLYT